MNFNLDKSIELLERTPEAYTALFNNTTHGWDKIDEGKDTWNAYQIIGHLIHGEKTDWIPRSKIILSDAEDKTFVPYDRFAQEKLYATQSIEELLAEFKRVRIENIETLKSWDLSEADLDKEGLHPDLGPIKLREMIATWTMHDIIHLNQLSRVFVKHYANDIGPFKNYVRLLKDEN